MVVKFAVAMVRVRFSTKEGRPRATKGGNVGAKQGLCLGTVGATIYNIDSHNYKDKANAPRSLRVLRIKAP